MYRINELSKIAGISTRTLRYYDSIGLLSPTINKKNKYRLYTETEIDLLQQILFYKELGFSLSEISNLIHDDKFSFLEALYFHKEKLVMKQKRLTNLLRTIDKTILKEKGETTMSNEDKFINLKESIINENEEKYGQEIRKRYGDDIINASSDKIRRMSKWEFNEAKRRGKEIRTKLSNALQIDDPSSKEAQEVCSLHEEWIKMYWSTYSKEAHFALVEMYTKDERFKAYYEEVGSGATEFLFKAMSIYLKKDHK